MVPFVAASGDGFHPSTQVGQGLGGAQAQRRVHVGFQRQPSVEQLLARPGRFAEVTQAHHPGAAFERVEGAPHSRHVLRAVRRGLQPVHRRLGVGHDLACFLDEDVAHLGVVFQARSTLGHHAGRWHGCWRGCGLWAGHAQALRRGAELGAQGLAGCGVRRVEQPAVRGSQQPRQIGLIGGQCLLRQAVGVTRQAGVADTGLRGRRAERLNLGQQGQLGV